MLRLRKRLEWGAKPPAFMEPEPRKPVTKVFFWYHTPTYNWRTNNNKECCRIMLEMQRRHMERCGLADIAFHFIVALDGYVYEGRELGMNTPRDLTHNPTFYGNRIDIAYMGDFLVDDPPSKMIELGFKAADYSVRVGRLHKLYTYTTIREAIANNLEGTEKTVSFREVTFKKK